MLLGDHAGQAIPAKLGDLGVSRADLGRHIACDIGVAGLGRELARRLDAPFIHQTYSRLVIDCNRATSAKDSIAPLSDGTIVPGNADLTPAARQARITEIYDPYHARIAAELDARQAQGRRTILVSVHSFTPIFSGAQRKWRFGVLHRNDSVFSRAVLKELSARWPAEVGDNEPYAMEGIDFTIPFHADARGLDYLELETRQDTIAEARTQAAIGEEIEHVLRAALAAHDRGKRAP